ncbi:unnamed protein product [Jaminaea pallidilutea]
MAPSATTSANGSIPVANGDGHTNAAASSSKSTPGDYTSYLSVAARSRLPSPIRSLFPAEKIPGMISLLAGKPNADTYPIANMSLQLKPVEEGGEAKNLVIQGADLEEALQYGMTDGLPRLNAWLVNLQSTVHRCPVDPPNWKVTLGTGSQDLLNKSFEALLDPEVDSILCESPAYAGILPCLSALRVNIVSVESDEQGLSAKALSEILASWPSDRRLPKAIYTTPTGANPSGTTSTEQRKGDVLSICRQYGILILEDDPYYYLNFEGLEEDSVTRVRPQSYFSLDQQHPDTSKRGLVLRYDSFSKILSGGMRLGFMTANPTFTTAIDRTSASANLHCSGVAQAVALAILEHWTLPGFLQHVDRVATFYKERRDRFEGAARKILGGEPEGDAPRRPAVAHWITPKAGMFLWLKLRLPRADAAGASALSDEMDSFEIISNEAKAAGVLAVPGKAFMPNGEPSCYVRTSFSLLPEDQFDEGFRRLRGVVEKVWEKSGQEMTAM